ncbi:hypothetical protein ABZS66_38405 [Dactylosporangium sp. NPDC005572]|uniref:hypothetical protein n=1 Tax=Dactylosporangium sp. NPDC005572 TaxID=3156889 RepID=UPI0033A4CFD9
MDRTTSYAENWHRQPSPFDGTGRLPDDGQWSVIAALWLLAAWSDEPGWRSEAFIGTAADRSAQPWGEAPALADLSAAGGLTATGARVLTAQVQDAPGRPYEPTRPQEEVRAEVAALLAARIPTGDERTARLLEFLAARLAVPYPDLLHVDAGDGGLHLLRREHSGRVLRVTVAPGTPGEADLRTRLACLMTLLGRFLWVDNNNPVSFRAWIGPRTDEDPAQWWVRTREDPPDDVPRFLPLTEDEFRAGIDQVVRGSLIADLDDEDEDEDDEWPPLLPPGHLAGHLCEDLVDLLLTGVGGVERLAYAGYFPVTDEPDEEYNATIVIIGEREVAVLDIDLLG